MLKTSTAVQSSNCRLEVTAARRVESRREAATSYSVVLRRQLVKIRTLIYWHLCYNLRLHG